VEYRVRVKTTRAMERRRARKCIVPPGKRKRLVGFRCRKVVPEKGSTKSKITRIAAVIS